MPTKRSKSDAASVQATVTAAVRGGYTIEAIVALPEDQRQLTLKNLNIATVRKLLKSEGIEGGGDVRGKLKAHVEGIVAESDTPSTPDIEQEEEAMPDTTPPEPEEQIAEQDDELIVEGDGAIAVEVPEAPGEDPADAPVASTDPLERYMKAIEEKKAIQEWEASFGEDGPGDATPPASPNYDWINAFDAEMTQMGDHKRTNARARAKAARATDKKLGAPKAARTTSRSRAKKDKEPEVVPTPGEGQTLLALRNERHAELVNSLTGQAFEGRYVLVDDESAQGTLDLLVEAKAGGQYEKRLIALAVVALRVAYGKSLVDNRGALMDRVLTHLISNDAKWTPAVHTDSTLRWEIEGTMFDSTRAAAEAIGVSIKKDKVEAAA